MDDVYDIIAIARQVMGHNLPMMTFNGVGSQTAAPEPVAPPMPAAPAAVFVPPEEPPVPLVLEVKVEPLIERPVRSERGVEF